MFHSESLSLTVLAKGEARHLIHRLHDHDDYKRTDERVSLCGCVDRLIDITGSRFSRNFLTLTTLMLA